MSGASESETLSKENFGPIFECHIIRIIKVETCGGHEIS